MPETKYFSKTITLSLHSHPASQQFPAKLAYWTFGSPSNPAVLLPTCYSGTLASTLPILYSDLEATDTNSNRGTKPSPFPSSKFFIILIGLLGGSESSSPSNTPAPWDGPNFPHTTYEDNVRLQHALCVEALGVRRLFAYVGFSMGGQQAYHMAALFPDFVEGGIVALATSARTSWHNWSFLEGPRHALVTAHDFHGGRYAEPAREGVKAFKRVYATWALSQAWFRGECWREAGFETLEAYLEARWTDGMDANDLLAMLWTWQRGDITKLYPEDGGNLAKTLGRIETKCLIMPSRTDMYFPPEDSAEEVRHLRRGELKVIESVWGHIAGGGNGTAEDCDFIKTEITRFLGI